VGLLILAVAVISAPFVFSTLGRRFSEDAGGPLGGRLLIWQASWLLIREHPWGGSGIGNASLSVVPYFGMLASRNLQAYRGERISLHNPVLQIWAGTGIPGILCYLGVLGSAIWLFVRQYCHCRGTGRHSLASYFALVSCVSVGVMLSWIKGGGMEQAPSYFLLLALLVIPSCLDVTEVDCTTENEIQDVGATGL